MSAVNLKNFFKVNDLIQIKSGRIGIILEVIGDKNVIIMWLTVSDYDRTIALLSGAERGNSRIQYAYVNYFYATMQPIILSRT